MKRLMISAFALALLAAATSHTQELHSPADRPGAMQDIDVSRGSIRDGRKR